MLGENGVGPAAPRVGYAPRVRFLATTLLASLMCACTPPAPSAPEARVPTTTASVSKANPAGDAAEPEDAAATRLLEAASSERPDRWHSLGVQLPDAPNWRRVRFFGHPTRVSHRYGDDHFAVDSVDYRAADGDDTPEGCLSRFVDEARAEGQKLGVEFGAILRGNGRHPRGVESIDWEARAAERKPTEPSSLRRPLGPRGAPLGYASMPHVRGSGEFTTFFRRQHYVGAVVALKSWPGTCLIRSFAVKVGTDEELATRVVDRWLDELAPRTRWSSRLRKAPAFENR